MDYYGQVETNFKETRRAKRNTIWEKRNQKFIV
jgi:hypothetical protein